jgi:ribosomal protein S18 acetylase RimI-like enzyme
MVKTFENDPVMTDRKELYIDDLCVDESIRSQGLGGKIFSEVCRYAKMRKIDTITLNVWCGNENAMAFYEKLGMKPQKIGMELNLA